MLRHTVAVYYFWLFWYQLLRLFYITSHSIELMEPISQNLSLPKSRTEKKKTKKQGCKVYLVHVYVGEQEKMKEKEPVNS